MLRYIGVGKTKELIADKGIETFLTELAVYIEEDFKRWEDFEKEPRYASHSSGGVIELMPISDGHQFSFKYVNGHPKNFEKGLQTVTAFGVLSDVETGYPILMAEMTLGTALRTAAMSALAAKYLAREDSKTMTLIGQGCQAEFQALAFKAILGIDALRLYDVDVKASEKFVRNMKGRGFDIKLCQSSQEAVKGADVITTVTADKQRATILSDNMVGGGVHINAIGGDCPGKTELAPEVLNRGRVFVEFEEQSRIEGDIQQMPDDFEVTELWHIFSEGTSARQTNDEITIFDSVGFALEDYSYLRYVYEKSNALDMYDHLDLLALPEDPKNLFGVL